MQSVALVAVVRHIVTSTVTEATLERNRGIWENAGNVTQFVNNQDQGHQVQAQLEVQNQGQPDHDVPEFENIPDDNDSICSDPDDYQYSFRCASYILRMKETYNLTQKAVNDLIVNTETFVREGIQAVSQKIKDEVTNLSQVVFDQVKWDDIDSDSSGIANPFQGMKTTTTQRRKFKDMFGFIVSMDQFMSTHIPKLLKLLQVKVTRRTKGYRNFVTKYRKPAVPVFYVTTKPIEDWCPVDVDGGYGEYGMEIDKTKTKQIILPQL